MVARQQPEQHAPPVQRLRVTYARRGRARFTSHRDFGRAFERALRRAGVPMAYSSGYSPHPRISYAGAAPTGAASEAEFLEIALAETCDPESVRTALNDALPAGFVVLAVVEATAGLADALTGSRWRIDVAGVPEAEVRAAVSAFLAASVIEVQRMTKNGVRSFDTRAAVVDLVVVDGAIEVLLEHCVPLVRPDDVLTALRQLSPAVVAAAGTATRLAQGTLDRDGLRLLQPR